MSVDVSDHFVVVLGLAAAGRRPTGKDEDMANTFAGRAGQRDLFQDCRRVPALEAARRLGLAVSWRGGRGWALCPLHGDSSPSLMFDPRGRWHCFGCGRGGDAVDLLAQARGMAPLAAARALLGLEEGGR